MCAGACGYLLKKTPPDKLLEGVREVYQGAHPCLRRWRRAGWWGVPEDPAAGGSRISFDRTREPHSQLLARGTTIQTAAPN